VDKLTKHSTGDWDYSGTNWALDSAKYISAPSAFRTNLGLNIEVLIKTTTVPIGYVKEGRLVTYFQLTHDNGSWKTDLDVRFRKQDASNYYYVRFQRDLTAIYFCKVVAGSTTTIRTKAISWTKLGVWHLVRVTWWNDYVGLVIRVERFENGAWTFIDEAYDSENLWKTIGGRVGFFFGGVGDPMFNNWLDDTEIYGIG